METEVIFEGRSKIEKSGFTLAKRIWKRFMFLTVPRYMALVKGWLCRDVQTAAGEESKLVLAVSECGNKEAAGSLVSGQKASAGFQSGTK